eukprot:4375588-Prymnesium_polylepis.1
MPLSRPRALERGGHGPRRSLGARSMTIDVVPSPTAVGTGAAALRGQLTYPDDHKCVGSAAVGRAVRGPSGSGSVVRSALRASSGLKLTKPVSEKLLALELQSRRSERLGRTAATREQ